MALRVSPTLTGHIYSDVLYSFIIGFVAAIFGPKGVEARICRRAESAKQSLNFGELSIELIRCVAGLALF